MSPEKYIEKVIACIEDSYRDGWLKFSIHLMFHPEPYLAESEELIMIEESEGFEDAEIEYPFFEHLEWLRSLFRFANQELGRKVNELKLNIDSQGGNSFQFSWNQDFFDNLNK